MCMWQIKFDLIWFESLDNLFWYCPYAPRFRPQVQEWLKNCNIYLQRMLEIAILGDLKSHSQSMNNIIIILTKMFIFNLQSVEAMRTERSSTFVKHHSTVEKYMANGNSLWMVLRDSGRGWMELKGGTNNNKKINVKYTVSVKCIYRFRTFVK